MTTDLELMRRYDPTAFALFAQATKMVREKTRERREAEALERGAISTVLPPRAHCAEDVKQTLRLASLLPVGTSACAKSYTNFGRPL